MLNIPDVKVRCRSQGPDEPPCFARARFSADYRELSGALGDLGTFLPYVIGAIAVVGMAPAGILLGFGAFYLATGAFYGLPMAVQPMKAASAAFLAGQMTPGAVAGAGFAIGLFFLAAGVTGLVGWLARVVPGSVSAGIQIGLGFALASLAIGMIRTQLWLGVGIALLLLVLFQFQRVPAALIAIPISVVIGQAFGLAPPMPDLSLGLHLPSLVLPTWDELLVGLEQIALPQIPLTLANAILVTVVVTRDLYPREVHNVTERNLSITTGLGNLLTAPFGGFPMCHGSGGVVAHHRFGARTGTAPVAIGLVFIALGLLLGENGFALLQTIPEAALGALLLVAATELAVSAKPQRFAAPDLFIVIVVAVIGATTNPAVAFVVGLPLAWASQRGWIKTS